MATFATVATGRDCYGGLSTGKWVRGDGGKLGILVLFSYASFWKLIPWYDP